MWRTRFVSWLSELPRPRRWLLPLVLALAAVRVVAVAQIQLPFNGWDELPHLAVAYHVHKTGAMPTPRTPMPRELVPFITAHPHPTTSLSMLRGNAAKPYPGGDPACSLEPAKRYDMFCYQAQHGPLLYFLAAPFLSGSDPASLLAWADGVRLINGLLLLPTLFLWHRLLRRVFPRDGRLSWLPDGVIVLAASFSYVFYNFARFSNDALALFLGTFALALYLLHIAPRPLAAPGRLWRYALLGAVIGLAVLAKSTTLALVPALGLSVLWQGRRPGSRRAALVCAAALAGGYLAVAGWHHAVNFARYGQPTAMQEAALNAKQGYGPARYFKAASNLGYGVFRNPVLYNAIPHVAGWSNLRSPDWMSSAFKLAVTFCAAALAVALVRSRARREAGRLGGGAVCLGLLWVFTVAALGYHAVHSAARWGVPTTGGWYGMLALPVTLAALLAGPALCGRRAGSLALLLLVGVFNAAFLDGTYGVLPFQETGAAGLAEAGRVLAGHHALPRIPLPVFLAADVLCLAGCLILALEAVWRSETAGKVVALHAINVRARRRAAPLEATPAPIGAADRALP